MPSPAAKTGGDVFLTLRLPRDLHDELKQAAVANDRTKAAETRHALRQYLDRILRGAAT